MCWIFPPLACVNSAIIWMFGTCFLSFFLHVLSCKWWFGCVHESSIPIFSFKSQPWYYQSKKQSLSVLSLTNIQGQSFHHLKCRETEWSAGISLKTGSLHECNGYPWYRTLLYHIKKNLTQICFKLQTESYSIGCSFLWDRLEHSNEGNWGNNLHIFLWQK